jgi:allantoinase
MSKARDARDARDLVVFSKQVFISATRKLTPASIWIKDGKIQAIKPYDERVDTSRVDVLRVDDECVVLPGVVDSHVHVNEPGRVEWEGFDSATRAAVVGGCTTLADMPLNSIPPTTTVANLHAKHRAAEGKCWMDVRFIGGAVNDNADQLQPMLKEGVVGFKCFLINSGVEEFHWVNEQEAKAALKNLQGTGSFLMFHAELEEESKHEHSEEKEEQAEQKDKSKKGKKGKRKVAAKSKKASKKAKKQAEAEGSEESKQTKDEKTESKEQKGGDPKEYKTFLQSRPCSMENRAIEMVVNLCREFKVRCHIVHLSSAEALPIIRKAKADGLPLTVETCYHYLFFDAESIPNAQPKFKCCPPIREKNNQQLLWEALADGTIDFVVSDHSPCTKDLKAKDGGDFMKAWGGISSLQFGLSILHTAATQRGHGFSEIVRWLSENTSKLLAIDKQKGKIEEGYDADLVVFDPKKQWKVQASDILYKNKFSAYEDVTLVGSVRATILRGVVQARDGKVVVDRPHGQCK